MANGSGSARVGPRSSAGAADDALERQVERLGHRPHEAHEAGAAARAHQRQQKAQAQQRARQVEDAVEQLADPRRGAQRRRLAVAGDDVVERLAAEPGSDRLDRRFGRQAATRLGGDSAVKGGLPLATQGAMLLRPARFLAGESRLLGEFHGGSPRRGCVRARAGRAGGDGPRVKDLAYRLPPASGSLATMHRLPVPAMAAPGWAGGTMAAAADRPGECPRGA